MAPRVCYLALGSNRGDRLANLRAAVAALQDAGMKIVDASSVYETTPVGGPEEQELYLNAVLAVKTDLGVRDLVEQALQIEAVLGRTRGERNAPRVIDIDVLLAGSETSSDPRATVPHPRMHERLFVLTPLREIAAGAVHPALGKTVDALYEEWAATSTERVRLFAPPCSLGKKTCKYETAADIC